LTKKIIDGIIKDMPKIKTNKTAKKRVKFTNPKDKSKIKGLYNPTRKHHLQTKRSARSKRRKLPSKTHTEVAVAKIRNKITNIKK
jgi:ribosomal protein L35